MNSSFLKKTYFFFSVAFLSPEGAAAGVFLSPADAAAGVFLSPNYNKFYQSYHLYPIGLEDQNRFLYIKFL